MSVQERCGPQVTNLTAFVEDYQEILPGQEVRTLVKFHDFTPEGAEELYRLATEYGWFFLRNACALAMALDIEDGSLEL